VLPDERVALHARLRQAIQDHVTSGSWRPGDQIPTIRQLGELYGVSHITVVKALDSLSRDGLLVRRQGKGIFVVQPTPDAPQVPLRSFTEETIGRGQTPSSRTLILRREPADPRLSARLGLRKGDDVVLLRRLRLIDGSPVAIQQVYLPAQFVPGLIERTEPIESLYQLLADTYDNVPANALESYTPTHLSPDQARLLETRPRALAFRSVRTTSDQRGRTVEFTTSWFRADKYEVRLVLSRGPTRANPRVSTDRERDSVRRSGTVSSP
jgi:GntR family transcriptional regulator